MLGQSKLAFRAPFGLHGNMPPAEHSLTSLSATDESIHGPAVFATTHWSVVLEAQSESAAAQKPLETLPHVSATDLWLRAPAWRRHSRRRRSYSELFRIISRAQRSEQCAQGKRTTSFVFACVSETFFRWRIASCHGAQTW